MHETFKNLFTTELVTISIILSACTAKFAGSMRAVCSLRYWIWLKVAICHLTH